MNNTTYNYFSWTVFVCAHSDLLLLLNEYERAA